MIWDTPLASARQSGMTQGGGGVEQIAKIAEIAKLTIESQIPWDDFG
jgi:hypothetical protein